MNNNHRNTVPKIALALAGLLLASTAGFAYTVTSTDNLSTTFGGNTSQAINLPSYTTALQMQGYNPDDFTLTSVALNFTESSQLDVAVFNVNGATASFKASTQALNPSASLTINGATALTADSAALYNGTVNTGTVPYTFGTVGVTDTNSGAAFSTTDYSPSSAGVTANSDTYEVAPADFSSWISSTPNVSFIFTPGSLDSIGTTTSGTGQLAFGGSTFTTGGVSVSYTFKPSEAAPEPSTWMLILISAALVVGGWMRRQNA